MDVGLEKIRIYVTFFQNTMAYYIATRSIFYITVCHRRKLSVRQSFCGGGTRRLLGSGMGERRLWRGRAGDIVVA